MQNKVSGNTSLSGNWKLTERNYKDENVKKTYLLHPCEKQYTLIFEYSNGKNYLTKNYSTGKNCEIKSNSGRLTITITESSFSYLDLDLKRTEYYKINDRKLYVNYNEILDGKVRQIEDVYEKVVK
ncbi:Lipocalin-like domain-containing protein [Chryseobacterium sp. RU37D]|nr:Lipocalin-like domain-containing protein [Chryseobacterium sp. RU37D]